MHGQRLATGALAVQRARPQRTGLGAGIRPATALAGAAQLRPEADADLATLDPRSLGLVRWADPVAKIWYMALTHSRECRAIHAAWASMVTPTGRP